MSLLRAFRNLALTARRSPVWAIGIGAMSPLALLRHLFGVAVLFLVTGLVLSIAVKLGLAQRCLAYFQRAALFLCLPSTRQHGI